METQLLQKCYSRQEQILISKTRFVTLQQLTYTFFSFSSSIFLVKNGLTALDIAEDSSQLSDYEAVISLLKKHMGEESTSPLSHHVSVGNEICPAADPRRGNSNIFFPPCTYSSIIY